jgi:hypothetical protein
MILLAEGCTNLVIQNTSKKNTKCDFLWLIS